jgi:hypothetical protein
MSTDYYDIAREIVRIVRSCDNGDDCDVCVGVIATAIDKRVRAAVKAAMEAKQ